MYDCGIYRTSSNGYLITFTAKLQDWTPLFVSNCRNDWLPPILESLLFILLLPLEAHPLIDYQISVNVAIHETSRRIYLIKLLYLPIQVRFYA